MCNTYPYRRWQGGNAHYACHRQEQSTEFRHTLLLFYEHESTSGRDREPSVSTFVTVYELGKERGKEALTMNRVPEG